MIRGLDKCEATCAGEDTAGEEKELGEEAGTDNDTDTAVSGVTPATHSKQNPQNNYCFFSSHSDTVLVSIILQTGLVLGLVCFSIFFI